MVPDAFKKTLLERGERYTLETIILNSKPIIFGARVDYENWRSALASAAKISRGKLLLVGSGVTGFSLAPAKFGRAFSKYPTATRRASDLDVVLIDYNLFHECWAATVFEDRRFRLRLFGEEKAKLMQDVYYGFISEKVTPPSSKISQRMISVRSICGRMPASTGLRVNMRIYHREDDFIGYQIASLRALKRMLNT